MSENNDKDADQGGFPQDVLTQMTRNHSTYIEEERRRNQNEETSKPSSSDRHERASLFDVKHHIESGLNTIFNLPKIFRESRASMLEAREQKKRDEREEWQRWTGLEDSPDYASMIAERAPQTVRQEATSAAMMLLGEAHKRNTHVAPGKIEALYSDDSLQLGGYNAIAGMDTSILQDATFAKWAAPVAAERWLSIAWFKSNPYSPINVEAYAAGHVMSDHICWRLAFEDLLNASLDKPMSSHEQIGQRTNGRLQSTVWGPGLDWMLSLQCRGILPPQLPALYEPRRTKPRTIDRQFHLAPGAIMDLLLTEGNLERAFGWVMDRPEAYADFNALVDEIATPAPAQGVILQRCGNYTVNKQLSGSIAVEEAEAEFQGEPDMSEESSLPLSCYEAQLEELERQNERVQQAYLGRKDLKRAWQEDWDKPPQETSTELDMYEHISRMMQTESERAAVLEEEEAYYQSSRDKLFEALQSGDPKKVAPVLSAWHKEVGNLNSLLIPMFADEMFQTSPTQSSELHDWQKKDQLIGLALQSVEDAMKKIEQEAEAPGLDEDATFALFTALTLSDLPAHNQWKQLGHVYQWNRGQRLKQEAEALGLDEPTTETPTKMRDAATQTPPSSAGASAGAGASASTEKVDVLSSLTTTSMTRLPDGTVTTKIVLKQRFVDGREEMHEKVHTYQEASQQDESRAEVTAQSPKKSGWFWS